MRRETIFEVNLRQENARLRNWLRWAARHTPTEVSNQILAELDGLPRHRAAGGKSVETDDPKHENVDKTGTS